MSDREPCCVCGQRRRGETVTTDGRRVCERCERHEVEWDEPTQRDATAPEQ